MSNLSIAMAGCGALGSQIALHLARPELNFILFDDDVVEDANILTSAYQHNQIGMRKVDALAELLWNKCGCVGIAAHGTVENPKAFCDKDLIIDTFDNFDSRALTQGLNTLHVGVSVARTGEIIWDFHYILPPSNSQRGENPICTHELGAGILRLTAAVAADIVEKWMASGERIDAVVTERLEILK